MSETVAFLAMVGGPAVTLGLILSGIGGLVAVGPAVLGGILGWWLA